MIFKVRNGRWGSIRYFFIVTIRINRSLLNKKLHDSLMLSFRVLTTLGHSRTFPFVKDPTEYLVLFFPPHDTHLIARGCVWKKIGSRLPLNGQLWDEIELVLTWTLPWQSRLENSRKRSLASCKYLWVTFKVIFLESELENDCRNKTGHLPARVRNMTGGEKVLHRHAGSYRGLSRQGFLHLSTADILVTSLLWGSGFQLVCYKNF